METRLPTYPNPLDEVFSHQWQIGQQYYVHFVGIVASQRLPDGVYTLAEATIYSATFGGCGYAFGSGHYRLYPVNWQELEIQREKSFARMPVFIPMSAIRMRRSSQIAGQ